MGLDEKLALIYAGQPLPRLAYAPEPIGASTT